MREKDYGVVCYVPCRGRVEDDVHFEGWWVSRDVADDCFEVFKKRYPKGFVHVVTRVRSEWREAK